MATDANARPPPRRDRGPNVLVLSAAGKPIFVRHGSADGRHPPDEDAWSTACGVLQGLRASVLSFGHVGRSDRGAPSLGDVRCVEAGGRMIVFLHAGALTLVAISDREDGNHNEAWLRLQLEHVYMQVLFTLTDQVQGIFGRSPGYDLRSILGTTEAGAIRNLLDRFDPADPLGDAEEGKSAHDDAGTGAGSFLTTGVECVRPVPPEIREHTSRMLVRACGGANGDNLFAALVVGTRLVTIVQPSNPMSQLRTSDLQLILTFVGRQPGLLTNELWFPLCLPRLDPSGFLYAYTSCLDPTTGLSIVLISPDNGAGQFESFRAAANTVRRNLGLRAVRRKVLRVLDTSLNASASSGSTQATGRRRKSGDSAGDLSGQSGQSALSGITAESGDSERKRTHLDDKAWSADDDGDEPRGGKEGDRVDGKSASVGKRPPMERQLSQNYYMDAEPEEERDDGEVPHEAPLLTALKVALSPKQQEEMMASYLQTASAIHFVFRCDIFVSGETSSGIGASSPGSMLTQCFGPPLTFPFADASSRRRVWDVYHRLSLRLRLGSASSEATADALDAVAEEALESCGAAVCTLDGVCPMQRLLEAPPNIHSVTYLQEDNECLFVGLNGKFFELYATLPATVQPNTGAAYCARLVRRLMGDERILFLSNPLTWGS